MVAERLEVLASNPTKEQLDVAAALGIKIPPKTPATVAAVVLRAGLEHVLRRGTGRTVEIPEVLREIERELKIAKRERAVLITGTSEELSAWFEARYMIKSARGLRAAQPNVGDIVATMSQPDDLRVISSIGEDGRVYMKGRPPRKAWPNHLSVVERVGGAKYAALVASVESALINGARYDATMASKLVSLEAYKLPNRVPSSEAIRGLEELLESGERKEEPFQSLLTKFPALLGACVSGGWDTYVIPKQRLGAEHVTDFLVLGLNSVGPQWLAVELEAPRHKILTQGGSLSGATRHAIQQIQDWREWLTKHIAYAHSELNLHGLTNRVPGLVVIGRDNPSAERQASRAQSAEDSRIDVHSWDWILRTSQRLAGDGISVSEIAWENAETLSRSGSRGALSLAQLLDDAEIPDTW